MKAEVVRQERSLDKLNVKLLEVEKTLAVKQKNVDSLKEQKKNIYEMVERELSDNKHSEFLWALYHKKPTAQYQQEVPFYLKNRLRYIFFKQILFQAYESQPVNVIFSSGGLRQVYTIKALMNNVANVMSGAWWQQ